MFHITSMNTEKRRLLIVDDEPDTVSTLETFFSLKGYSCLGALSGKEALGILEKEKIDSVILDIKLPDIPGTDIARIIKDKYPSTKIIVLSGYLERPEDLMERDWLEAFFVKPVKLHELHDKLSEIITPKESSTIDLKKKEGIKARVLIITAKLLIIEPSLEIYNFLLQSFKKLSQKGEDYLLESARTEDEISERLSSFRPDLVLLNSTSLKTYSAKLMPSLDKNITVKEIITYNIKDPANFSSQELEKLSKSVETACFKNGLLDIRWIEI